MLFQNKIWVVGVGNHWAMSGSYAQGNNGMWSASVGNEWELCKGVKMACGDLNGQ